MIVHCFFFYGLDLMYDVQATVKMVKVSDFYGRMQLVMGVKGMHQCLQIEVFDEKNWDGMTKVFGLLLTYMFISIVFS